MLFRSNQNSSSNKDEKKNQNNETIEQADKPNNKEVKIGDQTWTTSNLDVALFQNGDTIPLAKNDDDWKSACDQKKPMSAYYDYDESNGAKYGRLYNWYAVKDKRKITPNGWHVSTRAEWEQMRNYLGGDSIAGKKLKTKTGWEKSGNGTNESGFFAIPAGTFHFLGGGQGVLRIGQWWTSSEMDDDQAYAPCI